MAILNLSLTSRKLQRIKKIAENLESLFYESLNNPKIGKSAVQINTEKEIIKECLILLQEINIANTKDSNERLKLAITRLRNMVIALSSSKAYKDLEWFSSALSIVTELQSIIDGL